MNREGSFGCISILVILFLIFRLVLDRETGKPKGYGFCEYKDEETALSARRNLHGYEINGRQLRVDFAENDKRADRNREQVIVICLGYTTSSFLSVLIFFNSDKSMWLTLS